MPPPLNVNREAIRMLAQEIGTRPAARAVGLNEDTVCYWSAKEKWHEQPAPAATLISSSSSISPAKAHAELMQELGGKTRLGLARGLANGAEHVAGLDGASVLAQAGEVASLTKSSASVHGWGDGSEQRGGPVLVNVDLRGLELPASVITTHDSKTSVPVIETGDPG